jgi:Gametolysin peptidase M11
VHELAHTLGLAHARSWACVEGSCGDEYGNPFSAMGNGDGDFSAYEKSRLGWLGGNGIVRPRRRGTYELGSIEGPTTLPQALVVTTAAGDFWFESRGTATPSETGDPVQPPGIAVLAGPGPGASRPIPVTTSCSPTRTVVHGTRTRPASRS